jgi:hypothetical protein
MTTIQGRLWLWARENLALETDHQHSNESLSQARQASIEGKINMKQGRGDDLLFSALSIAVDIDSAGSR